MSRTAEIIKKIFSGGSSSVGIGRSSSVGNQSRRPDLKETVKAVLPVVIAGGIVYYLIKRR